MIRLESVLSEIPYKALLLTVSLSCLLLLGSAAHAQSSGYDQSNGYDQSPSIQESSPGASRGTSLPEWAEPGARSNRDQSSHGGRSDLDGRQGAGAQFQTKDLGPPGNPSKVPLSGLEWLLLAGAGYGFFKLREDA